MQELIVELFHKFEEAVISTMKSSLERTRFAGDIRLYQMGIISKTLSKKPKGPAKNAGVLFPIILPTPGKMIEIGKGGKEKWRMSPSTRYAVT